MTVAFGVDSFHFTAEELAVRGGVAEVVDGNIIVNHLMEDSILDEFFRQIVTGVDAQFEVGIGPFTDRRNSGAKEPGGEREIAAFDVRHLAEKGAGIGEFDGDRRQRPVEKADIEVIEMLLNIWQGWNHCERKGMENIYQ